MAKPLSMANSYDWEAKKERANMYTKHAHMYNNKPYSEVCYLQVVTNSISSVEFEVERAEKWHPIG